MAKNIKNNRICFFDNSLIDLDKTTAVETWHKPEPKDFIFKFDKPWEDKVSFPHVFKDGDVYKLYYVCSPKVGDLVDLDAYCVTALLISKDGIRWERPNIGIHEFNGSKENNIVYPYPCEFSVLKDTNPNCKDDERYKALNHVPGIRELYYLKSSDGITFTDKTIISNKENFDTLSTAFYSEENKEYFAYIRGLTYYNVEENGETKRKFRRDIKYITSKDFINWSDPKPINFIDDCGLYEIYTNCVFPYYNAPQYKIAFPTRYYEDRVWSPSYDNLTGREDRIKRGKSLPRSAVALTDAIFMSSTDDINWRRSPCAFYTPGLENTKNWVYGNCYPARGSLIETENELFKTKEMSFFDVERLTNSLLRYTLRVDGFCSYQAQGKDLKVITKPFIFKGENLYLNVASTASGGVYVTLKSKDITLESYEVLGDDINKLVSFKNGSVKDLEGKEVIMEISFNDGDVYSFKFE